MAAENNSVKGIFDWIVKIIDSTTNPQQERCVYNLISQFEKIANKELNNKFLVTELCNQLQVRVLNRIYG